MLLADRRRIAAERLAAMRIAPAAEPDGSIVDTIARTVHHHLAMQAQDVGSGMWSVGVRTGATRADVEAGIEARLVTRSWPMRGTLHLMATQDVRWMCRLLNERMVATQRRVFEAEGLTEAVVDRARGVLVEALTGGVPLSRPAAIALLEGNGVDPSGQRAYHLVGRFCQEGLLCQGPAEGRQPTFVLIDEWVPQSWAPDREEAMAALATRYVASHGPVTERDLAGWCNQNLTFAREAVALAGDAVTTETIGGQAYLVAADRPEPAAGTPVRLLPGFDEYVLGYKDRSAILTAEEELRVVPGKNGMFLGTVVVGGLVVGTWNRKTSARRTVVTVTPFGSLSATRRREIERAAAAYGRHLGSPAEVTYQEPVEPVL
ncbi:MAG TPA: winged helix DNA-binding domain-containing protein [Lapillicoccus sp.]|nr:winged helix DNA-binding domain-containing protein [Lapillicoccus sp.]